MGRAKISKGLITTQNQGGGTNKADIPSTIGRTAVLTNTIKTSAYNGLEIIPSFSSPSLLPSSAEFTGTWADADTSFTLNAGQQYENLIVPNTSILKFLSAPSETITAKVDEKLTLSNPGLSNGQLAIVTITF